MPQKKPAKKAPKKALKKTAPAVAKKPVRPGKSAKGSGIGAALKSAAKSLSKKVGLSPEKKALPAKKTAPAKPEKAAKKLEPKKPLLASGKTKAPLLSLVKGKKEEPKKVAEAPKGKGGKAKEVVLEVPAPKGVALLAKEGKGKKPTKAEVAAAAKLKRCREPGCEHDFTLQGYCRLHYIKNWRRIKRKEAILASGQLNNYVEELVNKYPDKYLDVIRQDLASEKEWSKVVTDLELESSEEELGADEDLDTVAEGVRPSAGAARGAGLRR